LSSESPPHSPGGGAARRPLVVLIVEDNIDTAFSLFTLLKLAAHDPHVAASGEEALQIAKAHPPDVVLLDLGLPGLDGYAVAERLRTSIAPPPNVAAVTARDDDATVERSRQAGFDRHFVKPVSFAELAEYLNRQAELRGRRVAPRPPG
jgi:two-component system OmpR family response regulator